MAKTSVTLNGFGTTYICDFALSYEVRSVKSSFEILKERAKEPFILEIGKPQEFLECYELHKRTGIRGIDIFEFLVGENEKTFDEQILSIATEDKEWGAWRNEGLKWESYKRFNLTSDAVDKIIEEADRCLNEIEETSREINEEIQREEKEKEEEKEKLLQGIVWNKHIHDIEDEGGHTKEVLHTFSIKDKKYKFYERNAFDFGRVINTDDRMLIVGDSVMAFVEKQGWQTIRTLNEDEARCVAIIEKYGYFTGAEIRMYT